MATQQEVIKKFMASLDTTTKKGEAALNDAVKDATGGKYSTIKAVIDEMKKNIASVNNADTFLKNYCGIDLTNTDTGAITSKDAGGSKVKTAESIVPESGAIDTSYKYSSIYNKKYDITFYLSEIDANGYVNQKFVSGYEVPSLDFNTLTPQQAYIWQGLNSQWAEKALDLITESYGSNFGFGSSTLITPKKIYFGFYNRNDSSMAESGPLSYNDNNTKEKTIALVFRINMNQFDKINMSDPNGAGNNGEYIDRTLAHEFTHCVMAANINYYTALPQFIKEGMAELTHGGDDGASNQSWMRTLAGNQSLIDSALDLNNTGSSQASAYAGGYMFLRYLAKQGSSAGLNVDSKENNISITGTDYADTIINSGTKVTITGGKSADTISNIIKSGRGTGNYALINGGDDNDSISVSGSYYVTVNGGADNDTIIDFGGYQNYLDGGAGNDLISVKSIYWDYTLAGGKGNDTLISNTKGTLFKYASGDGNDLIRGFTASDTLSISGGAFTSVKSGQNYVFSVGEGKITLEGAGSLSSVNVSGEYKNPLLIVGKETADNFNNTLVGATIQGLGGNDTIRNTGSKASILGGKGNDIINEVGSTSHDNTITGGAGNDTINLASGAGTNDVIEYSSGDGNDLITGFNASSTLKIGGGKGTYFDFWYGKDLIVQVGENMITLSGAASLSKVNISGKKSTTLTLTDAMGGNWTLGSMTKVVDGSKRTKAIKISAGAPANSIVGGSGNDSFFGGAGNDTLYGGKGNDTLIGGAGADVFLYASGDGSDIITDYAEEDLIKITSGKVDKISTTSAGSVVLKIGSGNLTLDNAADKIVSYEDAAGKKTFSPIKFNSKSTAATLLAAYGKDSFDFADFSGLKNLDASAVTHKVNITGNALANKIIGTKKAEKIDGDAGNDKLYGGAGNDKLYGKAGKDSLFGEAGNDKLYGGDGSDYLVGGDGKDSLYGNADADKLYGNASNDKLYGGDGNDLLYGGDGKDSLWGEAGNDSLWGGSGNDTFIYKPGEGTDKIFDYETGDMLKILNADGSNGSFKKSKYSGGDLTLTINGGGKIILYDVSTSDTFNINGTSYKISGSKLK